MTNYTLPPAFTLKPQSIFEGDDPTLDPMAISHGMPPNSRLLPGSLAFILYGSIIITLFFLQNTTNKTKSIYPKRTSFIDIQVRDSDFYILPEPKEGPSGGGGGQGGDGFRPPASTIINHAVATIGPSKLDELIQINTTPNQDRVDLSLPNIEKLTQNQAAKTPGNFNLSLPIAHNGSGRTRGYGPGEGGGQGIGSGGGIGGGHGSGGKKPKTYLQFLPISAPKPYYKLSYGEPAGDHSVYVTIIVQSNGSVSSAKAFKGPTFLYSNAEATALTWKFHPLKAYGLNAPHTATIQFEYSLKHR